MSDKDSHKEDKDPHKEDIDDDFIRRVESKPFNEHEQYQQVREQEITDEEKFDTKIDIHE
jgi:hypothetical protein